MRMLVLIILLFTPGLLAITFENNGYQDVIVTIHPDVPEVNGQNIINNIKVCTMYLIVCLAIYFDSNPIFSFFLF